MIYRFNSITIVVVLQTIVAIERVELLRKVANEYRHGLKSLPHYDLARNS